MYSIDLRSFYLKLLLLFPISTLLQSVSFFEWINKFLFALIMVTQVLILFYKFSISKKWILSFVAIMIVHVYSFSVTSYPIHNSNMLFYFAFWYLYAMYFTKCRETMLDILKCNRSFIFAIIIFWTVIVGLSIFFPSSYIVSWGNSGRYFVSITNNPFRIVQSALMISVLVLVHYCIKKSKMDVIYMIVPAFCFFMCGSRTYCGIGLLVIVIFWYIYCSRKSRFYISLIPLIALFVFLIINGSIGDKIDATTYTESSYYDESGTITSGRTVFWEIFLERFFEEKSIKKFLGCGFNYVYDVSTRYMHHAIWAHNDFISIMLNFGFLGLGVYIYTIYSIFREYTKNAKIPAFVVICSFLIWFINAMFNMFYTYFCSVICFPLMLLGLNEYFSKNMPKKSDNMSEN